MTLTWYDILVLLILAFTTYRGAKRGLVWQLAWIAALVLCFGFAESISIELAPAISRTFPQVTPPLDRWIAMLVLYMGFSFLSFGLARVLRGWIEKARFVEYDRHLGGIFGLVKGVVFCLVMTFFVITLSERTRSTVLASHSGYGAAVIMDKLEPVMPRELAQILEPYMQRLDPNHIEDLDQGKADPFDEGEELLADDQGDGERPGDDSGGGFWDRLTGGDRQSDDRGAGQGDAEAEIGLRDFLKSLPGTISLELQRAAVESFRGATPSERRQLMKQVETSLPGDVGRVLQEFNRLKDGWNTQPDERPDPTPDQKIADRNKTLTTISELFSDRPAEQQRFREQVNQRLTGVPERVAAKVLADWAADLMATEEDPDPGTTYETKLDVRIYRQLAAARVPLDRLGQALQQRMLDVSRR